MGVRPNDLTIERIDNNGNYEPGNCRWATRMEQSRNTRRNRYFLVNGTTMVQTDASRFLFGSDTLIARRLCDGFTLDEAMNLPNTKGGNPRGLKRNPHHNTKFPVSAIRRIRMAVELGIARKELENIFSMSHSHVAVIAANKKRQTIHLNREIAEASCPSES
jgi:hypothetical protein